MVEKTKMDQSQVKQPGNRSLIIMAVLVIVISILLYFLYKFLFVSKQNGELTTIVPMQIPATTSPDTSKTKFPSPYEGGDYSVSFWMYISSFNVNRNKRKHILEIAGNSFSTLLVGLGAYKNTLMVRTHSKDPGNPMEGFQANAPAPPAPAPAATTPPNAADMARGDGSLTQKDVTAIFSSHPTDDGIINSTVMCDAPDVDLQRWVHVTIVLSGRTIDVYIDGKLERSCITKSYYKVDPTGTTLRLLDHGGFDGYLAGVNVTNSALNPGQIYRIYSNGPTGASKNVVQSVMSIFTGK